VHREVAVVQGKTASIADPLGAPSSTLSGPYVSAFAPLLLHPRPHFFLGAGPAFFHEFGRAQVDPSLGGERTSWSGRVTVGGWWGGEERTAEAAEQPPPATTPRFGEEGQWVITGQAGASVAQTTYGGVDAPQTSVSVAPGVDYFPVSRVSFGASAFGSYGHFVGRQPDGTRVESTRTAGGITGRIGVDAPLGASFSWYPRVTLSFREQHWEGSSGKDRYDVTLDIVSVGLYAPVLFHAASHLFVGFGPYVARDMKSTAEGTASDNFASSVGADLLVGGWL
jgi:hypothetical protein